MSCITACRPSRIESYPARDLLFNTLIAEAHRRGELNWDLHHINSTIVRAHQQRAGAREGGSRCSQPSAVRPQTVCRCMAASAADLARSNRQLLRQRGIGCVIPRAQ
jgi:hypothetical protein